VGPLERAEVGLEARIIPYDYYHHEMQHTAYNLQLDILPDTETECHLCAHVLAPIPKPQFITTLFIPISSLLPSQLSTLPTHISPIP